MTRVNCVLRLREADYCYGVGELVLRVVRVADRSVDAEWVEIMGREIDINGTPGRERCVSVRIAALREALTEEAP